MNINKLVFDKIKQNEEKINESLRLMNEAQKEISFLKLNFKEGMLFDSFKLITSEKYRIETAILITDSIKKAANMLNMSERSLYRKRIKYNI